MITTIFLIAQGMSPADILTLNLGHAATAIILTAANFLIGWINDRRDDELDHTTTTGDFGSLC